MEHPTETNNPPAADKREHDGPDTKTLRRAALRQLLMDFEALLERLTELIETTD